MQYANLRSMVDGSFKDQRLQAEHIQAGLETQNLQESYTIKVPTITLTSILYEFPNLSKIDFLSLDVEGYELNVLKGLDLDKYMPTYILVEANFFDEVHNYLESRYKIVDQFSPHDFLYKLI